MRSAAGLARTARTRAPPRTRRTSSRPSGCARPGSWSRSTRAATSSGTRLQQQDVWVGSHLDTVPQGGRFDGALGVVAALEAVERTRRGSVVVFPWRGGRLRREPRARRARRSVARCVPRAARRTGSGARERGCTARRRHRHRRLRAGRARVRRPGRACGNHADERPARTRSWMRQRQSCGSATRHARSRAQWRRWVRSPSNRPEAMSSRRVP